ncbi:WG repeat-containing protein [Lacinutrix sp. MEBiC02404]
MKHLKLVVLFLLSTAYSANAQSLKNIDALGHFNEGLMAISNGNSWGFIDTNGTLVIDYRKDIVATATAPPIFSNGLCLIEEKRENIVFYGYINTKGETVIPTEYIAATSFENGFARAIKYYKIDTGDKNTLGKNIVNYSYNELVMDTKNKFILHISGPHNLLFDKLKSQHSIPTITSKFIGDHLISVKEEDSTYSIHNLLKQ